PACLSSRMYLKIANWRVTNELECWAEPLCTFAWYHGAEYPENELKHAWKMILKNHPHDSICGCSIDRVHSDMETRFSEASDIITSIVTGTIYFITSLFDINSKKLLESVIKLDRAAKIYPLIVFNSTNWEQSGPVRILNPLIARSRDENIKLVDHEGTLIEAINIKPIGDYRDLENGDKLYPKFKSNYNLDLVEFLATGIPQMGYKVFFLVVHGEETRNEPDRSEVPELDEASSVILKNEYLRARINADGTIDLLDKVNDDEWRNLMIFEDSGDDGDEYDYAPTRDGLIIKSLGNKSKAKLLENSRVKASCETISELKVPACITLERKRSDELKSLKIKSTITLYKNERFLRLSIDVDNNVEDHRLRVLFPTQLETDFSHAATHFMVIKRTITLPRDDGWYQPAQGLYHTDGFVDITDGKKGVAVFMKGLPEFEIIEEDKAIAITLFRSVGFLSRDGMPYAKGHLGRPSGLNGPFLKTPGAQCKRKMRFELAIYPHAKDWQHAKLYKFMKGFQSGLRAEFINNNIEYFYKPKIRKTEPIKKISQFEESTIEIYPEDLVLSALKKAEQRNGIIIRIFNPTQKMIIGSIKLNFEPTDISIINLNEEFIQSILDCDDGQFEFEIKACQIMTFLVKPKRIIEPRSSITH
ncbi:MAG: glycoside hydrolase family 38 C-terminal domain-containing protein, partial [Promethearchaeota archaeon]